MKKYEIIVFDIDGTLARSKLPIDNEIADLLCQLMEKYKVAIISGANYEQFKWQILNSLKCNIEQIKNLFLLPVDGTIFCNYKNDWQCQYDVPLSEDEKNRIRKAFDNIFIKSGLENPEETFGEIVEDRGSQLNFSALGQKAPIELKEKWDIDCTKRTRMIEMLSRSLPEFSMRIGGTTSIQVTRVGVDKAYGLKKLMTNTNISKGKILYIGDKFLKDGNDAPVLTLDIDYKVVKSPEETKQIIRELL